jgi:hypothetical protein
LTTSGTLVWYYHWWINRRKDQYREPLWVRQWLYVEQQADVSAKMLILN